MKMLKFLFAFVLAASFMGACIMDPNDPAPPDGATEYTMRDARTCMDSVETLYADTRECAELKDIYPTCVPCVMADSADIYRDAVTAWEARCVELECPWCYDTAFPCNE